MRFWNFGLGNAHTMYEALVKEHTPFCCSLDMSESVNILAHYLMQYGPDMRKRRAEHPNPCRNLSNVHDFGTGRKKRSDVKGEIAPVGMYRNEGALAPNQRLHELRQRQQKSPWCVHQSLPNEKRGRCTSWGGCPGFAKEAKRRRSAMTQMGCEECSAEAAASKFIFAIRLLLVPRNFVTMNIMSDITTRNIKRLFDSFYYLCCVYFILQ
jgi:hypothetical protein